MILSKILFVSLLMPTITTTVVAKQPSSGSNHSSNFLRGEALQSLLEQTGIQINHSEIEICASRIGETDCHTANSGYKCVHCPNSSGAAASSSRRNQEDALVQTANEDEEGVCLPAAVFALACPKSSRSLLSKRYLEQRGPTELKGVQNKY